MSQSASCPEVPTPEIEFLSEEVKIGEEEKEEIQQIGEVNLREYKELRA